MPQSQDLLFLPMVTPSNLDLTIFPHVIEHMPEFRILYCHRCKQVCFPQSLDGHLADLHKVPAPVRRTVVRFCATLDLVDASDDLVIRPDGSVALDFAPIYDGYSCHCCRFLTTSRKMIRQHLISSHYIQHPVSQTKYSTARLQSWYPPSSRSRYWIITSPVAGQASYSLDTLPEYSSADMQSAALLESLEGQEQQRLELLEQDHLARDAEVEEDETTPWLRYTKWPGQFAGRPLDIIVATARQPRSYPVEDYALGYWQGEAIVSRLDWEIKLGQLVGLVDQVFDRCESTLDATPPALCCWLKSFTRHRYYPKPFRPLQRPASKYRYRAYWKRYICFLFRSWLLEADFRADIYGVQYTELQCSFLNQIWATLSALTATCDLQEAQSIAKGLSSLDADPLQLPAGLVQQELIEYLFQLSCATLTDVSATGDVVLSPLIYYVGILGVHQYSSAYQTAYPQSRSRIESFRFYFPYNRLAWNCRASEFELSIRLIRVTSK
jgi:hypothetical protein